MAHREHARHIRRRDDNGVSRTLVCDARRISREATLLQPERIPLFFNQLWLVSLRNLGHVQFILKILYSLSRWSQYSGSLA